ncbi:MAG: topoisomerase DNA-binding C4 zinc finger domain-containing protein [Bacteroidaceae bacterium]|nr:topoisomerase DNA-binding C4 zinc finger domain-containing protein [Bacteroidaceae bacterium]
MGCSNYPQCKFTQKLQAR